MLNSLALKLDESFPRNFDCEYLAELPPGPHRHFYFPGGTAAGGDGHVVRVRPHGAEPWVGTFTFGRVSPNGKNGLFTWPDPNCLCVVSVGDGYIVRVDAPTDFQVVRARPILDVRPILAKRIVVFANFTELVAYGRSGVLWRTGRLSWEGIDVARVTDTHIEGTVWDPRSDAKVEFIVDLETGRHQGGLTE